MIDRSRGLISFECDGCSEVLDTGTDEFNLALSIMRRDGWHSIKSYGNEWEHFCPKCRAVPGVHY